MVAATGGRLVAVPSTTSSRSDTTTDPTPDGSWHRTGRPGLRPARLGALRRGAVISPNLYPSTRSVAAVQSITFMQRRPTLPKLVR